MSEQDWQKNCESVQARYARMEKVVHALVVRLGGTVRLTKEERTLDVSAWKTERFVDEKTNELVIVAN
jgi:hypothetical protein